ncbi:putative Rad21/Rec8-like protein N-terminal domain-containing protein [Seiridium cardinale]
MFYSHEILNSRQYGVATIWLVATIGNKFNVKRVGKKAIQEVDVTRACEKIIEPGAPIALRLQGSLLYGVSKVYEQKCHYMLTDVQKIQGHMMTFLRQFGANQLDPAEVRARQVSTQA